MQSLPHHYMMEVTGQRHNRDNDLTAQTTPGTQWLGYVGPGAGWDCVQTRKISTAIGN